jgi:DNA-binding MarR family transcriptional regulator
LTHQLNIANLIDMSNNQILEGFVMLRRSIAVLRAAELKDVDCGHNQISILYRLSQSNATMGELAEYTLSDKGAITRTVALLSKAGFVKRTSDAVDKRVVNIELTPKGKIQARKAQAIRNSIGGKLDNLLTRTERQEFLSLVNKIVENLKIKN